jgi:hypothetical protein
MRPDVNTTKGSLLPRTQAWSSRLGAGQSRTMVQSVVPSLGASEHLPAKGSRCVLLDIYPHPYYCSIRYGIYVKVRPRTQPWQGVFRTEHIPVGYRFIVGECPWNDRTTRNSETTQSLRTLPRPPVWQSLPPYIRVAIKSMSKPRRLSVD